MNCTETKGIICDLFTLQNLYLFGGLLFFLIVIILIRKRQPKSIVAYRTENGEVTISRSAIVELVRAACEQINQISKPSLKVFTKKGLIHFTIHIQMTSSSSLKEIEEVLQNHLRENLSKNLGIENLGNINFFVKNFKSGRIRPAKIDDMQKAYTQATQTEEDTDSNPDSPESSQGQEEK